MAQPATKIPDSVVWVGGHRDARVESASYEGVLNVAINLNVKPAKNVEYHKVGLIDGPGNELSQFAAAVFTLDNLIKKYESVLINCMGGMSRSPTVLAAWWSWRRRGRTLDDALNIIAGARPCIDPSTHLVGLARKFLYDIAPYFK